MRGIKPGGRQPDPKITLETLDASLREHQVLGGGIASTFGLVLLIAAFFDVYFTASGQIGILGSLIGHIFEYYAIRPTGAVYRTVFFIVVAIQCFVLFHGLRLVSRSYLRTGLRAQLLQVGPSLAGAVRGLCTKNWAASICLLLSACGVVALSALTSLNLVLGAALPDSITPQLTGIVFLGFTVGLSWIGCAMIAQGLPERYTLGGIIGGFVVSFVAPLYYQTPFAHAFGRATPPPDIQYYELAIAVLMLISVLLVARSTPHERMVFQLWIDDHSADTSEAGFTPFGIPIVRQIALFFQVKDLKILAFTQYQHSKHCIIIDTMNKANIIPLNDRMLSIWNLSYLERLIAKREIYITDSSGMLAVTGTFGLSGSPAGHFRPGEVYDATTIENMANILLRNQSIGDLFARCMENYLNDYVHIDYLSEEEANANTAASDQKPSAYPAQSMVARVQQMNLLFKQLKMRADAAATSVVAEIEKIHTPYYTAARLRMTQRAFEEASTELETTIAFFNSVKNKAYKDFSGENLASIVEDQAIKELLSESPTSKPEDIQKIVGLLGLRINMPRILLQGSALECEREAQAVRDSLVAQMKTLQDALDAQNISSLEFQRMIISNTTHLDPALAFRGHEKMNQLPLKTASDVEFIVRPVTALSSFSEEFAVDAEAEVVVHDEAFIVEEASLHEEDEPSIT
jgi:hypothetical protein